MAEPKLTRAQRDQWAEELESEAVIEAACRAHSPRLWAEIDKREPTNPVWTLAAKEGERHSMRAALRAAVRALPVSEEEV